MSLSLSLSPLYFYFISDTHTSLPKSFTHVFQVSFRPFSFSSSRHLSLSLSVQAVPVKLSLDALLQMSSCQVQDTMRRLGSNPEECSRLTVALSCLKSATETGQSHRYGIFLSLITVLIDAVCSVV